MDNLQADIAQALQNADARARRKDKRFVVRCGERSFTLASLSTTGFSLWAADAPLLKGFVDIERGGERIARCLVMLASEIAGMRYYEFKRRTDVQTAPPVDYVIARDAPVALLS